MTTVLSDTGIRRVDLDSSFDRGCEGVPRRICDPVTGEAFGPDGRRGDLSPKQFALLLALAQLQPRGLLSREAAVVLVYGEAKRKSWRNYVEMLNGVVKRLNQSLMALGWPANTVRSVRGRGLRLGVPVVYLLHPSGDDEAAHNFK